jgi:Fe-S-cluster containining protein
MDDRPTDPPDLVVGPFTTWLVGMEAALRGEHDADVPCGTCTACCTSSQFVHIEPDETDALAHIPAALRFPAPFLPDGHVLLGYDRRGHCPMLVDGRCSIYEHRPRTCRTYDCRVFPAAGLQPDADKPAIDRQARRWTFTHPTPTDHAQHDAVRRAAAFVAEHPDARPDGAGAPPPTQLAVLAVGLRRHFLDGSDAAVTPAPDAVRVEIDRRRRRRP